MKKIFNISIMVMGFSGLVAQILLLRELMIVFSGNELSIGIILANWMILEAFGSYFWGKRAEFTKNKLEFFVIITIIFSLSLPAAVYCVRILKNILGVSVGQEIGLLPMFIGSFFILLPTSITHGALFTFGCRVHALLFSRDSASAGKVYVYETVGMIIGGIVLTYLLIPYLHTFNIVVGLAVLNLLLCISLLIFSWRAGILQKILTVFSGLILFFGIFFLLSGGVDKLHFFSIQNQWKNQKVVHYQNSVYGNICITESAGQYTFFSDGLVHLITPVPDIEFIEEFIHLPLLSHPYPGKVLILSGGAGGMIHEVLKHPSVNRVEYAELDPLMLELVQQFPTSLTEDELTDSRVEVKHIDGRLFLKTTDGLYDVMFVGLPGPSDLQTNRFFTQEFFSLAEKRLDAGGILAIRLPGSLTYFNDELRDLNSCIFHTIKSVFSYIRVIPGDGSNILFASNSKDVYLINAEELSERVSERGIKAEVAIPRNIERKLHPGWANWFLEFIEDSTQRINLDFKPLGFFYSIVYWNSIFAPYLVGVFRWFENLNLWVFAGVFAVLFFLIFLVRSKSEKMFVSGIPWCVGTTGFAGMMLDLVLIFTFQAIYGYVFSWIGLLVAFFMAGAAAGALVVTLLLPRIKNDILFFLKIDFTVICFAFMLPFFLVAVASYLKLPAAFYILKGVFLILSFASGFLVGAQFPLANKIYLANSDNLSKTAGLIYSADLLGGWLGGVVGSIILLPVLGFQGSCMVIVLIKLASFVAVASGPRKIFKK